MNRLIKSLTANQPIVGAGAGTGISAKFEERGGADLIIIYNSGLFRMAGCGSLAGLLAFSDANKTVLQMAPQVLSVVESVPVIAGINATDPFRQGPSMRHLLTKVKRLGFAGVQNFPTVGLIDGLFRANLEETGMGYQKEVAMIQQAHALGLLTTPYVFDIHQAVQMTTAGADVIVAHMGLTSSGSIGAKTLGFSLQDCAALIQAIADAAWLIRPDVIVLFHGGPIASPEDVRYIFRHTRGLAGFYGASSMERLPVETAITAQVDAFKKIPFWGQ
ncbi:MAG: phosphoenolpyruvate hydrolase family protein [archaeon]|nr:phosphoenolpyruvate hydrolase family protein [archaeon]